MGHLITRHVRVTASGVVLVQSETELNTGEEFKECRYTKALKIHNITGYKIERAGTDKNSDQNGVHIENGYPTIPSPRFSETCSRLH